MHLPVSFYYLEHRLLRLVFDFEYNRSSPDEEIEDYSTNMKKTAFIFYHRIHIVFITCCNCFFFLF